MWKRGVRRKRALLRYERNVREVDWMNASGFRAYAVGERLSKNFPF